MYKASIDSYFKKRDNFSMKKPPKIESDVVHEYAANYREVLNLTLHDIEQKDSEAAKIIYMLALLGIDFKKEQLKELFGDVVEKKIAILSRCGVVKTDSEGEFHALNIHDIIKEEAVKRLDKKTDSYKEKIIQSLVSYCKKFYSPKNLQYFHGLNPGHNHIAGLHAFIDIALQNDVIDEKVIDAVNTALRLNEMLFNEYANQVLHRQIANEVYNKNLGNISPFKRALLYANFRFADFIFKSEDSILKFEKEYLGLLGIIENDKNHKDISLLYVYLSSIYIVLGDFKAAKKYIEKAERNINYTNDIFDLLGYWYVKTWLSYELREIEAGMKALSEYAKLNSSKYLSHSGKLFIKDLEIKFMILIGQNVKAEKEVDQAIKDAVAYYNNAPSGILGELEYTKTLIYFGGMQYKLAEKQACRALSISSKVFGGDMLDLTQAHIHIMLGKIYELKGKDELALNEYKRVLNFYDKRSNGRKNNFYEYGELLSNLILFYYKQKNYSKSKQYFQKLVANFGLNHAVLDKLMKELPSEYMQMVGA